jgi:hypothetical protein
MFRAVERPRHARLPKGSHYKQHAAAEANVFNQNQNFAHKNAKRNGVFTRKKAGATPVLQAHVFFF